MVFRGYGEKTGRKRKHSVSFRMNDDEVNCLNEMINLSGLNKQQYMISKSLDRSINVYGNPKTYKNLKKYILKYSEIIERYIEEGKSLDIYQMEMLLHITEMLCALNNDRNIKTTLEDK